MEGQWVESGEDSPGGEDCRSKAGTASVWWQQTCPAQSPEEKGINPPQPANPCPLHLPPHQPLCWGPGKEDSLEKAVGCGHQPAGVDEDSSTEVRAPIQQAGLPRPLTSCCVLATVDLPHHLRLPTHCGDTPVHLLETIVVPMNATPVRPLLSSQMGKPRPKNR